MTGANVKHKRIFISVGEHSGDDLGADLMQALLKRYPKAEFSGIGGPRMHRLGLKSVFPLDDIAVMGLFEIIPHLPRLINRLKQAVQAALYFQPDILITIDAPDFNLRVAKRVKAELPNLPAVHYVSPSVWAWRPGRANKMAEFLNHVLALFPFEPPFYEKVGLPCTYVGHRLAREMAPFVETTPKTLPKANQLALLPGSRAGEIARLLPDMVQTFQKLKTQDPTLSALLPIAGEGVEELVQGIIADVEGITLLKGDKTSIYKKLQGCRAALVCSGTANLELALLGLPMVVVYRMAPLTHALLKCLVTAKYISPVNLVADMEAVPELIQTQVSVESMALEVAPLLTNTPERKAQQAALGHVQQAMAVSQPAADIAADVVASYLK